MKMSLDIHNKNLDKLLYYMLKDMEKAPSFYKPTNFWLSGLVRIISDIEKYGFSTFRQHKSAGFFYVPIYSIPGYHRIKRVILNLFQLLSLLPKGQKIKEILTETLDGSTKALADYRVFLASENDNPPKLRNISESQFGAPIEQFYFDGKYYSRSFLNYLRGLTFLKKNVDTREIKTVLEIGGGYGTLGEILLKCNDTNFFYIDVDIPPVSYVATRYLEKIFGKNNVASYLTTRKWAEIDLNKLSEKYRAVILCPWQLPLIKGSIDLFVNFISFQEMEPEVVANYVKHIDELVGKYVLLRNSRRGKQIAKKSSNVRVFKPVTREHYIKYFNKFKLLAIDSLTFGDKISNIFESEVMIFQRY